MNRRAVGAHRVIYPVGGVVLLLVIWMSVCLAWDVPPSILPTPLQVGESIGKHWVLLVDEGLITLKATMYGFGLALLLGIPLAVILTTFRWVNLMFYPLLVGLQSHRSFI